METIVDKRLDRLGKAHYRNQLKKEVFHALKFNAHLEYQTKGSSQHYINALLSQMIKKWRYTIYLRKQFREEVRV